MKKIFKYLTVFAVTLAIVACEMIPATTPDNAYEDATIVSETERLELEAKNITPGSNFRATGFAVNLAARTVGSTVYDEIELTFADGRVDSSATNLANITVYSLTNPTTTITATSVATREALTLSSSSIEYFEDTTVIKYAVAQDATTGTTLTADGYEVVVSPALTAYGEVITLNQDNDIVAGETGDDMYISTVNNSLTTKTRKSGSVSLAAGAFDGTFDDVLIDLTLATIPSTSFSATSLAGDFVVEKFNFSSHLWENVTYTMTYDDDSNADGTTTTNDGEITLDLPATEDRQLYRYTYKTSLIAQDSSLIDSTDYVVKAGTNAQTSTEFVTPVELWTDTADFTGTGIVATFSDDDADKFVEVQFNGANGNIKADTLTNSSITFFLDTEDRFIEFDAANVVEVAENKFRFNFNTTLNLDATMVVRTYPTIGTEGPDDTIATDDTYFGDSANAYGSFVDNPAAY